MLTRQLVRAGLIALMLVTTACTTPDSTRVFRQGEANRIATVRTGVVESVRPVKLEGSSGGVGMIAGAAIGGITSAGRIGQGSGSGVAGILGAVLGGVLGNKIERGMMIKDALEVTVRMPNGERLLIVEDADVDLQPGMTVDVINDGRTARVIPLIPPPPAHPAAR